MKIRDSYEPDRATLAQFVLHYTAANGDVDDALERCMGWLAENPEARDAFVRSMVYTVLSGMGQQYARSLKLE